MDVWGELMSRRGSKIQRGLRWGAAGLAVLVVVTASTDNADARRRHHRHHRQQAADRYEPSTASIVVDANSGAVMQASNADSPRHPASLTKIMTLYLLFERLEAGKIKLTSEMKVSPHAAAQAPSKLGLKPGETIDVETAIRAIVTKSANDVAVVVAEAIGGDETEFAQMMTAKARALGMMHTSYHNASGLPDDRQITTARDMAILGRAIHDRFPEFYHYFSTRTFAFRGKVMRNHNHLLGRVDGVDGIKTGYIHDSGFNIVTSVHRHHRYIVAVVFGGRSAGARDARMRDLIDSNINTASVKRTAPLVVDRGEDVLPPARPKVAAVTPLPPPAPPLGSSAPIKANPVKTFVVHPTEAHAGSLRALPADIRKLMPGPATTNPVAVSTIATVKREPAPSPEHLDVIDTSPAKPAAKVAEVASVGNSVPVPATELSAKPHSGWMIQVGAFDDEREAKERLVAAKTKAEDQLRKADPFTERIEKGDKPLFRARFAGLEKAQAMTACRRLKRNEIPCMVVKN
jgi:D-alanyl-D-alanine carboxypeptidase